MKDVRNDHERISPTAVLCARVRGRYTDMPYAKQVLEQLEGDKENILGSMGNLLFSHPRLAGFLFPGAFSRATSLEGRYVSTNDAMQMLGDHSVLEIAAGLSTRSLEQADGKRLYIETDLPGIIKQKRDIVYRIKKAKGNPFVDYHHMLPLNALDYKQLQELGEIVLREGQGKPVAIIHEGLIGYLSEAEQRVMRDNLAQFLRDYSPHGAWITPDFSSRKLEDSLLVRWAKGKIQKSTGREFTPFRDNAHVHSFLAEGGLLGEFVPNEHLVQGLTCLKRPGFNFKRALGAAENYRACFIQLK